MDLAVDEAALQELARLLSPDERERAYRFAFEPPRRQFVAARAALLTIVGVRLGRAPESLRFTLGPHGKPAVRGLEFSLSHSDDLALIVTSDGRRVGVDLERRREVEDARLLSERYFSPSECVALAATPRHRLSDAFLRVWTRKEAYLKARGDGLTHPLDAFDVSVDDPPRLLANRLDPVEADRWLLADVDAGPDYLGAVAVEQR